MKTQTEGSEGGDNDDITAGGVEEPVNREIGSIESTLDLSDIGAGYDPDDKRVARAIKFYENELLPFIQENSSHYRLGNYLSIKGYGTGIKKHGPPHEQDKEPNGGSGQKKRKH